MGLNKLDGLIILKITQKLQLYSAKQRFINNLNVFL